MNHLAIIVGASHAGSQLALSLRQGGWCGRILLIGDEHYLPYHRPPLSKDFLSGNKQADDLLIRPHALYEKNNIELQLDTNVLAIDRQQKQITLIQQSRQQNIGYDKLAICTGARIRLLPLPGIELSGIHYLRNLADVEAIRADLPAKGRGVIVGGGYIGLETAAMLRKMGHDITVLEAASQLLGRVAAKEIGEFYLALHRHHGVNVQTNIQIARFRGNKKIEHIELTDGTLISADFVVVGIGVLPNQELAAAAGLEVNNGILVDEFAQTSDPDIVAAGDCTRFHHPLYGDIRLESVPNATEQAKIAAATLNGKLQAHHSIPWFWSDQYDCKLQIAGLSQGYDEVIIRGDTTIKTENPPSFCAFYFKAGKLIAADCVNRPREFMLTKLWLQNRHTPSIDKLVDDSYELKKTD